MVASHVDGQDHRLPPWNTMHLYPCHQTLWQSIVDQLDSLGGLEGAILA